MSYFNIEVEPIRYNSRCVSFTEWVSLFTLCLAPLIAVSLTCAILLPEDKVLMEVVIQHIISGTPTISYLTDRRPRWYDRLCGYNPTSIIWRYAAIADRRIRAVQWSRQDLAATNAIFWTSNGWNGGEEMVTACAPHCLRLPEHTHVEVASLTTLKTIITTLQGVSALYILIGAMSGAALPGVAIGFGIDAVFFPLAILGLLRLCAATWLTEDFVYQRDGLQNTIRTETIVRTHRTLLPKDSGMELDQRPTALEPLITTPFETAGFKSPAQSWQSHLFRFFFLLLLGGIWTLALLIITPALGDTLFFTTTTFLLGLFYFVFITVTLMLYAFYFIRGQTTTTILPCISSTWYRIYTLLLMGLMMVLNVIASIETNKSPTGLYTSADLGTNLACADSSQWWQLPPPSQWIGIATNKELDESVLTRNQTSLVVKGAQETEFWLYNFTGFCMGHVNDL